MEILETSKLKQEAYVRLNSDDMVHICNALYEYGKAHKSDKIFNKLQARMIIAKDITQYGLIDGLDIERIKELSEQNVESARDNI